MPALSKKQQKFMGIVRSIQKGEQPASKFSKDAQDVAKDMKKKDVKKFASTKHKGLPMKKEILGKLKEMIKQELSEYTYGVGDVVKDVNPTCPHYGAKGKVKSVNPRSVVFVVMNKGKNFKPGMELEKSHDQMKKMNENKVVKVGDRKYKLTPLNSIPQIEKLAYNGRVSYRGLGVFGAKVFELSINTKVWHAASVKQKEQYFISGSDLDKLKKKVDDSPFLAGGLPFSGTLKGWKPIKPDDRVGIVSNLKESINEFSIKLKKSTQDMVDALLKVKSPMPKEIESALIMMAKGYGLDYVKKEVKKDAKGFYKNLKQMAAAFPEFKKNPKDYKFESIIQERNDEVQTGKEYTKLWLQSINLIIKQANNLKGALAKHPIKRDINKLKAVENLFKKFIKPAIETERADSRHYAPNQTELKKYLSNSKFKVAIRILKQTLQSSNAYNENSWYDLDDKTKKLIEKMSKVLYDIETKLDNANLESVNESMSPSQLKKMRDDFEKTGELPPHLKKFVKDVNVLKKKHKVKNIVVPGLEWMSDMKESINEDGHTDVASSKRKVMIMVDDANKLLNKLNGMNKEDSLPSWWSDKITLSQSYLSKATDFLLNPVESVNEIRNNKEAQTAMNQIGNKALYMIGAKDFVTGTSDGKKSLVFKIMRNSKGVSHIRMRLSSMDLYDMDFLAIRAGKIKIKSKEKGVYGDQLGAMIKKNTGLNIRL